MVTLRNVRRDCMSFEIRADVKMKKRLAKSKAASRERERERKGAEDKHCGRVDRTNPTSLIFHQNTQKNIAQA